MIVDDHCFDLIHIEGLMSLENVQDFLENFYTLFIL